MADLEQLRQEAENLRKKIRVRTGGWGEGGRAGGRGEDENCMAVCVYVL